jgi:hypothetical protein
LPSEGLFADFTFQQAPELGEYLMIVSWDRESRAGKNVTGQNIFRTKLTVKISNLDKQTFFITNICSSRDFSTNRASLKSPVVA